MREVTKLRPGSPVYGRRGGYVGRVQAVDRDWVEVREDERKGRTFFVPRTELIGMLPGGQVFISSSREHLVEAGWDRPPEEREAEDPETGGGD